jgi:hypothetical protein
MNSGGRVIRTGGLEGDSEKNCVLRTAQVTLNSDYSNPTHQYLRPRGNPSCRVSSFVRASSSVQ